MLGCSVTSRRGLGRLGALLPGGIHLFLEERLDERQQLPWQQPAVFVYEALQDDRCYENFHPDILLLPQREEVRPAWLPGRTEEGLAVPRGRDRGAVFSMPLVDLSTDRDGLPVSRIRESGEAGVAERHVAEVFSRRWFAYRGRGLSKGAGVDRRAGKSGPPATTCPPPGTRSSNVASL